MALKLISFRYLLIKFHDQLSLSTLSSVVNIDKFSAARETYQRFWFQIFLFLIAEYGNISSIIVNFLKLYIFISRMLQNEKFLFKFRFLIYNINMHFFTISYTQAPIKTDLGLGFFSYNSFF